MKGEYNIENLDESHPHNNHNHPLFTKYGAPHHNDALIVAGDHNPISDPSPISSKKPKVVTTTANDDVATVEVMRRPRGRPPGSKNKPKPPVVINREPEPAMSPYIFEVSSGSDVIGSLTRFTRRRGVGICVLSASGSVTNVILKQPLTGNNGGGTVQFRGRFDILSLSAAVLHNNNNNNNNNNNSEGFGFSIMLGGPQGQVFGGRVVEPLTAATTVYVTATSFNCHNYQRLPGAEVEERIVVNVSAGAGGDGHSGSLVSRGDHHGGHVGSTGGVGGGADVMWGPNSKHPLPPPY